MRRRLLSHIAAVALLVPAFVDVPDPIPPVRAGEPGGHAVVYLTEPVPLENLPRSALSDRTTAPEPIPLPTPVPIDPNATPIPGPTIAPVRQLPALVWPVIGPVSTWYSAAHPAIDIVAACGTPVVAPAAGTVVWAGWKNNGGGYVMDIDLGWGLVSLNHLSAFAVTGGPVAQGQVVAYVGTTGNSSGCHLHLALFRDGAWRNPLAWL